MVVLVGAGAVDGKLIGREFNASVASKVGWLLVVSRAQPDEEGGRG